MDSLRHRTVLLICIACTLTTALAVWLYVVPFQKERVLKEMILRSLNERIEEKRHDRAAAGKPPVEITRRTFDPYNYFLRKSSAENTNSTSGRRTISKSSRKSSYNPLGILFVESEDENEPSIKTTESVLEPTVTTTSPPSQDDKAKKLKLERKSKSSVTVSPQNVATAAAGPSQEDQKWKLQRKIACKKADTVSMLFSNLQIISACFAGFAHGSNDVCNAIFPLVSLYEIYVEGNSRQRKEVPIFILLYGGVGMTVGIWLWGRLVIQTLGEDITKITAISGFTITFCSAFSVVLSSNLGLPVSTTQCVAGAIIAVGIINARIAKKEDNAIGCMHAEEYRIDWALCRSLVYAWFLTVPLTAGMSAAIMFCFQSFVLPYM